MDAYTTRTDGHYRDGRPVRLFVKAGHYRYPGRRFRVWYLHVELGDRAWGLHI